MSQIRRVGPFSLRQVTLAIGVVIVAALVLTLATVPLGATGSLLPIPEPSAYILRSPLPGLRAGDLAPEFEGLAGSGLRVTLSDLDGRPVRLADLRGKAVWINFWASWCPPCQSETPLLRKIDEQYRDRGLVIVGVQVQQIVDDGRAYAQTYGLHYTIGADVTGAIFRTYKVFALPTQFFVDPNGIIRAVINGPVDATQAAALVESILPAPSAGSSGRSTPLPTASP